jgi:hypothetical protein
MTATNLEPIQWALNALDALDERERLFQLWKLRRTSKANYDSAGKRAEGAMNILGRKMAQAGMTSDEGPALLELARQYRAMVAPPVTNRYTIGEGFTVHTSVDRKGNIVATLERDGEAVRQQSGFERVELAKLWAMDTMKTLEGKGVANA